MGLFADDTPFQDDIDSLAQEFRDLRVADSERLERMDRYRSEMEATRETDLDTQIGRTDYGRNPKPQDGYFRHRFNLPFGQALTVKHAYRVSNYLPDATVERRADTPEERYRSSTMEKIWWATTRASKGEVQFSDGAWDGSQIGATCFEAYFDIDKQMALYRAVDPVGVIAVRGVHDPHDFERVFRYWSVPLASLQSTMRGKKVSGYDVDVDSIQGEGPKIPMVTVVQAASKQRTVRFALGVKSGRFERERNVGLWDYTHNYGFAPYIVIPNLGPIRNIWGWSDYEFVREIVRYLPVLFGREADVLRMVANGAFKAKGLKITEAQIREILAEGGILPVGREGDLEPVEAPQIPSFAPDHADRAMEFFERLGFAPAAAWGSGDSGSGSDRSLQLQPMFELTAMKQKNWNAGLSRLGEMCFRMVESKTVKEKRYTGTVPKANGNSEGFSFLLGPETASATLPVGEGELTEEVIVPRTPRELFDGEYEINFSWQNRIDRDDPVYVGNQLNLFSQGIQSLQTTLENLGFQAPEDEIALIEKEAEEHPWIRDGMLKLLEIQLGMSQQGQNDGSQNFDQGNANAAAQSMRTTKDGAALDGDAATRSLQGASGTLFGAA